MAKLNKKLRRELENRGLSYRMVYFRDPQNNPVAGMAILKKDDRIVSVGFSIVHPKDNPSYKLFHNKAVGRALSAFIRQAPAFEKIAPYTVLVRLKMKDTDRLDKILKKLAEIYGQKGFSLYFPMGFPLTKVKAVKI